MSSTRTMGIAVTDVDTTAQLPLGFKYTEPADNDNIGEKTWTYIFNDDGSTAFAAGDLVIRDPSAATEDMYGVIQAPASTAAHAYTVVGVAQHAIAGGSYGFVLTKGKGSLRTGTEDMTVDTVCTTGGSTAGSCLIFANGTIGVIEIGFSLEAKTGDPATFNAYINCLGA